MEQERAAFLPLPSVAFEACRRQSTTASSLTLVRFEPLHYLALLETKPGRSIRRGRCVAGRCAKILQAARV